MGTGTLMTSPSVPTLIEGSRHRESELVHSPSGHSGNFVSSSPRWDVTVPDS